MILFIPTTKFGGSINAEHGIGQLRKDDLKNTKIVELEKMKSIKIFDPANIFNPGKIFNLKIFHKFY